MAPLSSTAWGEKNTVLWPVWSPMSLHSPECSSLAVGAGSSVLVQAVVPGATSPGSCILADGWRSGLSSADPWQLLTQPATWEAFLQCSPGNAIGMTSTAASCPARSSIPAARPRAMQRLISELCSLPPLLVLLLWGPACFPCCLSVCGAV